MNTRYMHRSGRTAVALAVCLLSPPAAQAAEDAPTIDAGQPWIAILFALLATALVCMAAFKDAHRTHLD